MERTDWMIKLDSNTKFPLPVLHDSKRNVSEYNELDWVMRIREELDEALAAPTQLAKAQEIVDAITVGVSWLNQLGFDEASRTELYELSNVKTLKEDICGLGEVRDMKLRRIIHRLQPIRHIIKRNRRHKEMCKRSDRNVRRHQ